MDYVCGLFFSGFQRTGFYNVTERMIYMNNKYKYDVAISYQSSLEKRASRLADYLQAESLDVFFAPIKQREMLSGKLHQVLYDVYKNQSFVKVLLVTEEYLHGEWTSLEMRMSLDSTDGDRRRLVIINYMGEALPDELKVFVYLDGNKLFEDQLASAVAQRIFDLKNKKRKEMYKQNSNERIKNDNLYPEVHFTNNGIVTGYNSFFNDTQFNH